MEAEQVLLVRRMMMLRRKDGENNTPKTTASVPSVFGLLKTTPACVNVQPGSEELWTAFIVCQWGVFPVLPCTAHIATNTLRASILTFPSFGIINAALWGEPVCAGGLWLG